MTPSEYTRFVTPCQLYRTKYGVDALYVPCTFGEYRTAWGLFIRIFPIIDHHRTWTHAKQGRCSKLELHTFKLVHCDWWKLPQTSYGNSKCYVYIHIDIYRKDTVNRSERYVCAVAIDSSFGMLHNLTFVPII